ncbi:MAG: helix-turn-helix domain-containing protein [Actinomycetota bacterium]
MPYDLDDLASRLRRARGRRGLTQEGLAEAAQLSVATVQKLEQGQRKSAATATLIALANALDVELSELIGKRPELTQEPGVSVLAVRDALLDPGHALPVDLDGEPVTVDDLSLAIDSGWANYWAGDFGQLTVVVPALMAHARHAYRNDPLQAAGALARIYQLTACLLVHLGRDDLAVLAAERGAVAAESGDDQLQWASLQGTYSWALLHQGRTDAAESHAATVAAQIEPTMSQTTATEVTVWGSLLLTAMASAAAAGREVEAVEHLSLARTAAARVGGEHFAYEAPFGPTQVAVQGTHAFAVLGRSDKALASAAEVDPSGMKTISFGRHLIDVAQAHVEADDDDGALTVLQRANGLSPEWFRHQGPARALVAELVQRRTRLPARLRALAQSTGIDR